MDYQSEFWKAGLGFGFQKNPHLVWLNLTWLNPVHSLLYIYKKVEKSHIKICIWKNNAKLYALKKLFSMHMLKIFKIAARYTFKVGVNQMSSNS